MTTLIGNTVAPLRITSGASSATSTQLAGTATGRTVTIAVSQ